MPVTDVFEAEVDILELLDYKPIFSKGYSCIMHIHTFNDEVVVRDILKSIEVTDKGEKIEKNKPQFAKSHTKIICRISPKNPIAIEKFESIPQMGRFTLRDEGKTICVGKVLKYKPYAKRGNVDMKKAVKQSLANQSDSVIVKGESKPDLVFDMETGEMRPKAKDLDKIVEGNEEDGN